MPTDKYLSAFSLCFFRVLTAFSETWLSLSLKASYSYDFLTFLATSWSFLCFQRCTRLLKQLSSFFFYNFFQASELKVSFILTRFSLNCMRELQRQANKVSSFYLKPMHYLLNGFMEGVSGLSILFLWVTLRIQISLFFDSLSDQNGRLAGACFTSLFSIDALKTALVSTFGQLQKLSSMFSLNSGPFCFCFGENFPLFSSAFGQ